jgi:2-dehydropantoate 2-reductase
MRFLVVGAGALGGYFGGKLARAGADVSFLVRPRRAAQLAERGLVVRDPAGDFATPVRTVAAGAAHGPYDIVFLACKAYGLDAAIDDFAPALAPDGAVLPVLNGINHIGTLRDRLGVGRVLGGMTTVHAALTAEGNVVRFTDTPGQTAFGELDGRRSARCEAVAAAFAAAEITSALSTDILAEMWAKFCAIGAIAAIATLTRARAGEVAAAPAGAAFVAAVFGECARVTEAEGYPPPGAIRDFVTRLYGEAGSTYAPSILSDIENGRPTEGEHIVGDLVRRTARHGIAVPILQAALCGLQIHEVRRHAKG